MKKEKYEIKFINPLKKYDACIVNITFLTCGEVERLIKMQARLGRILFQYR